ncbi:MAG: hypothetical protein DWH78_07975 [Planctomycetota bacterium]|nr:MAG: hypothetical protein DWH78_07975 [Planctomycetota bacterium]
MRDFREHSRNAKTRSLTTFEVQKTSTDLPLPCVATKDQIQLNDFASSGAALSTFWSEFLKKRHSGERE